MASGEFNNASLSSDEEEEIFAGFTVEVAELQQRWQRQLEQDLREDVEEFMDLGAHKRKGNRLMLNFSLAKTKEKRKKKATIAQTKLKMFRFDGWTY